jgi:carbon monoxide dehydrogenase subunit G
MVSMTKSVHIEAPVEKVFAFMQEPNNLVDIWPSMQEVRHVQPMANGGYKYDWTYKMGGIKFNGSSETPELSLNERTVVDSKGGIESHWVWKYTASGSGTDVQVTVKYTVPIPVLGKLAESVIVKQNDHELDVLLANLKAHMEVAETQPSA